MTNVNNTQAGEFKPAQDFKLLEDNIFQVHWAGMDFPTVYVIEEDIEEVKKIIQLANVYNIGKIVGKLRKAMMIASTNDLLERVGAI